MRAPELRLISNMIHHCSLRLLSGDTAVHAGGMRDSRCPTQYSQGCGTRNSKSCLQNIQDVGHAQAAIQRGRCTQHLSLSEVDARMAPLIWPLLFCAASSWRLPPWRLALRMVLLCTFASPVSLSSSAVPPEKRQGPGTLKRMMNSQGPRNFESHA